MKELQLRRFKEWLAEVFKTEIQPKDIVWNDKLDLIMSAKIFAVADMPKEVRQRLTGMGLIWEMDIMFGNIGSDGNVEIEFIHKSFDYAKN